MGTLQTILAFIVTLGLLVSIHEYGHFWVARRCGVKVLRFCIGFGKPLFTWHDRHGTEFAIAMIPLGGYVKMLDEREGPVADEEKDQAFNNKSVYARIAVVAAGPIANFLLAIVALWLMYLMGVKTVIPVVGDVVPESPAAVAGMSAGHEVVSVDGRNTLSWHAINMALLAPLGETATVVLGTRPFDEQGADTQYSDVHLNNWLAGEENPDPLRSLGVMPWRPEVPAAIGQVLEGGAAEAAGLRTGDVVLSANGQRILSWQGWVDFVRENPGAAIQVEIDRDGSSRSLTLVPGEKTLADGLKIGYIGAGAKPFEWPADRLRDISYGPVMALGVALQDTWSLTTLTLDSIRKMVIGLVSVEHLSGPITIAKVAGASFKSGLESFLNFLAMLSISLGVLNLLPIPVLDGGHLLYYLVELVKGRPVPEKIQMIGVRIGMTLILGLMFVALYNDLSRL
ncbi:sigma E protease regulator RseP [Kistimonas asteriae]|uniref:sigma E protease regulator RseP n=1 Tax=Kistimonas asteriae TaxID=517724 RepID=UPI001BA94E73|nr:sigma E protease regulator RseP [Kistimonas asteriae]